VVSIVRETLFLCVQIKQMVTNETNHHICIIKL